MKKNNLVRSILTAIFIFTISAGSFAQRDIIYKNDSSQIRSKILSETADKYKYAYLDSTNKVMKVSILKTFVDSVKYNVYDSNLAKHKLFNKKVPPAFIEDEVQQKNWQFLMATGLNIGNILEFNPPSGNDKKSFSGTLSLDAGVNYSKPGSRFAMTNELHWLLSLQKSGLTNSDHIQRISDNINTLHDLSVTVGKTKKWSINLIVKANTSVFNIYDGEYFKDINKLGKAQAFLSPYDVTVSPGIKWQPGKYLRLSVSPYSFNLYGVQNQQVANTGIFITETDASGKYKRFLFKRLGAEINCWYDRRIKTWLDVQYRLAVSGNYFEKITNSGLLDGLFLTNIKILKNLYLTHRATFKADYGSRPFKPYYQQSVLLSFVKNF